MADNLMRGIIGILSALLAFGGTLILTQDQFDNAYVCSSNEKVGIFYGGISSTGLTGYPYKENRTSPTSCTNGKWESLKSYAEKKGLKPEDFMQKAVQTAPTSKYACNIQWCVEVDK